MSYCLLITVTVLPTPMAYSWHTVTTLSEDVGNHPHKLLFTEVVVVAGM